jgi:hypothetical protein
LNNHRSTAVHSCDQTGLVISIALSSLQKMD